MIDVILQAFASIVLDPVTLGLMLIGTLAGILAGAIPGFTIAMGVILTLPFTFGMTAIQGLATMLGVFVGGFSGGLMSCMLTGIPGTPSSVATTFDGFPLVRSGRPGLALGLGIMVIFLWRYDKCSNFSSASSSISLFRLRIWTLGLFFANNICFNNNS